MSTLKKCIELSGINTDDGDRIKAVASDYRKEGFGAQESNENAVKDAIKEIEAERKSIISQIKKAGIPPTKAKPIEKITKEPTKKPAPEKIDIGTISDLNIPNLAQSFLALVKTGEKLNKIAIQTHVAEILGIPRKSLIANKKYDHKQAEEAFEYAIVMRARGIISESDTVNDAYVALKAMHDAQPLLATRTSTSIKQQMYSTPVHLAYLAQVMANSNKNAKVYEPSGGTGMLLTIAGRKNVVVNEIDGRRIDILEDQGFETLHGDGTVAVKGKRVPQKSVDSVMANPPFGSIPPVKIDGYTISKIEHQMIADALLAMKDDGMAAFIIGGKNFDKGKMNSTQKVFLNWLYNNYYVKYNIDIPGKEYTRQGASFPIRLIVIDGRKKIERGFAPKSEDQYQSIEKIDELITGGFINGSLDASRLGETPVSKAALGGVRPKGVEGIARELPFVSRPEDIRPDKKVERVEREPVADIERPPAEGIPVKRPADEPKVTRPARLDEARPVVEPAGVVPRAVTEGELVTPGVKVEAEPGRREPGKPERVPARVERPDISELSGVDAIVSGLLELSKEEAVKAETREKTKAAEKRFKEGAKEVAEGFDELNALFGEEGWVGARETVKDSDPVWIKAKVILQKIWDGMKKMTESIKERAAMFVKDAYAKLSSKGMPYVNKFINEDIRAALEAEATTAEKADIEKAIEAKKIEKAKAAGAEAFQVVYTPKSKGPVIDETLIPRGMYDSVMKALNDLEAEVGSIDDYVKDKLKYKDTKTLYEALSSDQIDAVALSIRNIDKGVGMIVGDQTGVGKGRIAAAIIKYAQIEGKKPIFFTEKPNLFTDLYRDIVDIGHDIDPFIMASNVKLGTILDRKERVVHVPLKSQKRQLALRNIAKKGEAGLGEHDSLVSTYSQINKKNAAQDAIKGLADGNIIILDESHNASGDSSTGKFVRDILENVESVLYLSATFAKRPDTMPLYFRTALKESNLSMEDLVSAIKAGGLPLQEIVSSDLSKLGQYIRREKSFKGININSNFNTKNKKVDTERANGISSTLRAITKFDKVIGEITKQTQKSLDAGGAGGMIGEISVPGSEVIGGRSVASTVTTSNFASVVHNAIRQSLLSMKADMAIDFAVKELKAGRKPIIALSNTMGSFVDDQVTSGKLKEGSPFNLTMKDVMNRHLRRTLQVVVTSPTGEKTRAELPITMLSPDSQAEYNKIQKAINTMPGGDLPGSPIDYIKAGIIKAGYNVNELTGRTYVADLSDPGKPILASRTESDKAARNTIVSNFNNGQTDCLIVNAAGATGLSLHAAPGFKDKRPRTYIGLQAELNVDTEIQKMGRVNRKGQVALPSYHMLFLDLPTEIRPAAVLTKKLKSLSANTSAGADSPMAQKTLPDMMDKYGDEVTRVWATENARASLEMGINADDGMHKITGRLALRPVAEQDLFYEAVEQEYESLIENLKEEGRYDLEVGDVDFKAETIEKDILTQGHDEKNPFGSSSFRERLLVTMPDKPYNKKRIENIVESRLGDKTAEEISTALVSKIEADKDKYLSGKKPELDADEYAKLKEHVDSSFSDISSALSFQKIGTRVTLYGDRIGGESLAVVIDVKHSGGEGNPAALGRVKIVYALNTAMQKTVVTLSQLAPNAVGGVQQFTASDAAWDTWDSKVGVDVHQTRYMITGNLLQGYADATAGSRIVRYTTKTGETKEGVLLPLNYEPSGFEENVRVTSAQASKLVSETVSTIKSDSVVITDTRDGFYSISVPISKLKGGKFFLDDKLLSIVEGEFSSRAGQMEARVEKSAIPALVERFYELGEVFKVDRTAFRDEFGEAKIEEPAKEEVPLFKKRETSVAKGVFKEKDLQSSFDNITAKWANAPIVKVVQSQADLPKEILAYVAEGDIVDAVYYKGAVYAVADNLSSLDRAMVALLHESFGHFGLRGSLGKGFADIMNDVYISKREEVNKIAKEYGFDVKTKRGRVLASEEWLAREAVTSPNSGWAKRLMRIIRNFVRKLIPSLTLSDAEINKLLESARSFVEKELPKDTKGVVGAPGFRKTDAPTAAIERGNKVRILGTFIHKPTRGSIGTVDSKYGADTWLVKLADNRGVVVKAVDLEVIIPSRLPEISVTENKKRIKQFMEENPNREIIQTEEGDVFKRVVWGKIPEALDLNTLDSVGLNEVEGVGAIHVTEDPEFWSEKLQEDYEVSGEGTVIEISTMSGDILTDDVQYALAEETGYKADSNILVTGRKILRRGKDFIVSGEEWGAFPKAMFSKRKPGVINTAGFLPPIVEKRVATAKGVPKAGFKERLDENLTKIKAQRQHFPDLQTIEDKDLRAKVNDILRRHQEVPETAKNKTIQLMHFFTKDLSRDGYEVYRMNIFLADMMRDIRNGLTYDGKLPFGFETTAEVESSYAKYQKAAEQHPEIAEALKRRSDAVNSLKRRSVEAKILKKEVLKEDDYFHHQIIKYWQTKYKQATGAKEVRTHWRPWMAKRKGSMLDYNTDYIEAESTAIYQQLEQVLTVETLTRIKDSADVYSQLKTEARIKNNENVVEFLRKQGRLKKHPKTGKEIDPMSPWKQKIAMSNANLAKMAKSGVLEYDSEWQGLVDKLAKSYDAWKAKKASSPGQPQPGVDDARWFNFLSYLINTKKPGSIWAATILKSIRERNKFIEETLGDKFLTYKDLVPEGYSEWKPSPDKGWFWASVITDKILERIQRGELDPNDVEAKQLLAKGSDIIWIIPDGLAKTLDKFHGLPDPAWVGQVADKAMRSWKQYILLNPYSVIRYNLNNMSGDLDAVLAYAPEIATKYALQAWKDLRKWHKRAKLDPKTQQEIDFTQAAGAIQSGFSMQEVDDASKVLSSDKRIRAILLDENPNWFTMKEWFGVKKILTKYWDTVRRLTALRENVLRLSAYRFFLDNKDKRLYGASNSTEVNAITDPRERSAKLARELLGDYGNISKSGEYIRKRLMPFYSWMEINAPRYVYMMRNTKYENRDVDSVKKQMAAVAGKKLVLSSAKMALRASMLMGSVMLWNLTMFPDEEEEMGESGRRQMHIILGRREDGSIITLRFQGALSDALSYFALEDWPADMKDLLEGKRTVGEKLKEIPLAILNKGVQAIRPEPKMLGELISGKSFYPDVTRPMPIRDRVEHVLRTFKLDRIYREALERPGRGKSPGASRPQQMVQHFLSDLKSLLIYESDPGLLAYYDVRGMVFEWMAKQGDERRFGGRPTRKGNAFYYYKQAMKFGDLDAAQRYLKKYYDFGGTRKSHLLSIKYAHPLSSLPQMRRNAFRQSLDAGQEKRLQDALSWYGATYY